MSSVASLHDSFLRQHLPEGEGQRLFLDFSGYVTELVSNAPELLERLRWYFRDFLLPQGAPGEGAPNVTITALEAPPPVPQALGLNMELKPREPGKQIKEAYQELEDGRAVCKRLTGMLFLFGRGLHMAVGPCIANDNQIVNFINNRFIEWTLDRGSLLFHAAGVALPAQGGSGMRGLALAGFAGMGKSTLALHIMRHGAHFVSNDRLMVAQQDDGLTMYGVAKMPRINPGTVLHNPDLEPVIPEAERRRFEALPQDELWRLEHKYDAFIDECFGPGRFRLAAPMAALVLLNWRRPFEAPGAEVRVEQVDLERRRDLLPAFMKSVGLFYGTSRMDQPRDFGEQAYLSLLQGHPVFELTGAADFQAAARKCLELV